MRQVTLLLDTNLIIKGLIRPWSTARALLTLCAANYFKLALANEVNVEVLNGFANLISNPRRGDVDKDIVNFYQAWLKRCRPEIIRPMKSLEILQAEKIITHDHDAPILAAAIYYKPDFLLSNNRRHFSDQVAKTTGLSIFSDEEFFALIKIN